jgi:hypothetical protein
MRGRVFSAISPIPMGLANCSCGATNIGPATHRLDSACGRPLHSADRSRRQSLFPDIGADPILADAALQIRLAL